MMWSSAIFLIRARTENLHERICALLTAIAIHAKQNGANIFDNARIQHQISGCGNENRFQLERVKRFRDTTTAKALKK
jgi:hypothetical protein